MHGVGSWMLFALFVLVALPWLAAWVWALASAARHQRDLPAATGYSFGVVVLLLVAVPPVGVLIYALVVRPGLARHRKAVLRA